MAGGHHIGTVSVAARALQWICLLSELLANDAFRRVPVPITDFLTHVSASSSLSE